MRALHLKRPLFSFFAIGFRQEFHGERFSLHHLTKDNLYLQMLIIIVEINANASKDRRKNVKKASRTDPIGKTERRIAKNSKKGSPAAQNAKNIGNTKKKAETPALSASKTPPELPKCDFHVKTGARRVHPQNSAQTAPEEEKRGFRHAPSTEAAQKENCAQIGFSDLRA